MSTDFKGSFFKIGKSKDIQTQDVSADEFFLSSALSVKVENIGDSSFMWDASLDPAIRIGKI